ncbi:hypothetical protein AB1046_06900 [Promicromonospora sp. Populi]|uniref:hypothetical protein n=1 Tax=Promicromonospora sp. Populi TaxID=3239420 RepID=UPI0034E22C0F
MRFSRPIAVVIGALAALTLLATPASAESFGPIKSSCSGTLRATWQLTDGGVSLGRTELWYSSVSGGQNCVITYNYLTGSVPTGVSLWVDDNNNRVLDSGDRNSYDYDTYASYAGASYRNSTDGHCVMVKGEVSGQGYYDSFVTGWRNCG